MAAVIGREGHSPRALNAIKDPLVAAVAMNIKSVMCFLSKRRTGVVDIHSVQWDLRWRKDSFVYAEPS